MEEIIDESEQQGDEIAQSLNNSNATTNSQGGASTSFDLNSPAFSSDDFRIWDMKVKRCPRARPHDWTICPFAHPGEKATRRDPRKYTYSATACTDWKKTGHCHNGDTCTFSHGVFECWLHPTRYRTQMCADGMGCKRRVCFFAHQESELRHPENCFVPPSKAAPPPASQADIQKQLIRALAGLLNNGGNASPTAALGINHAFDIPPSSRHVVGSMPTAASSHMSHDVNMVLANALQELAASQGRPASTPGFSMHQHPNAAHMNMNGLAGYDAATLAALAGLAQAQQGYGGGGYAGGVNGPPNLARRSVDIGSLARNPFGTVVGNSVNAATALAGASAMPINGAASAAEALQQHILSQSMYAQSSFGSYGAPAPTSSSWAVGEGFQAAQSWFESHNMDHHHHQHMQRPRSETTSSGVPSVVADYNRTSFDLPGNGSDDSGSAQDGLNPGARKASSQSLASSSDGSESLSGGSGSGSGGSGTTSGERKRSIEGMSSGEESVQTMGSTSSEQGGTSVVVEEGNGDGRPPRPARMSSGNGGVGVNGVGGGNRMAPGGLSKVFSFDNLLAELPRSASQVQLTIS